MYTSPKPRSVRPTRAEGTPPSPGPHSPPGKPPGARRPARAPTRRDPLIVGLAQHVRVHGFADGAREGLGERRRQGRVAPDGGLRGPLHLLRPRHAVLLGRRDPPQLVIGQGLVQRGAGLALFRRGPGRVGGLLRHEAGLHGGLVEGVGIGGLEGGVHPVGADAERVAVEVEEVLPRVEVQDRVHEAVLVIEQPRQLHQRVHGLHHLGPQARAVEEGPIGGAVQRVRQERRGEAHGVAAGHAPGGHGPGAREGPGGPGAGVREVLRALGRPERGLDRGVHLEEVGVGGQREPFQRVILQFIFQLQFDLFDLLQRLHHLRRLQPRPVALGERRLQPLLQIPQ
mmetsp:Transcript_87292/g.145141  ORF Transcript_87292/g.145141 Transcript_87292/m.145141 type:complete len:341 (-) Transcript_87292:3100-4122(-)